MTDSFQRSNKEAEKFLGPFVKEWDVIISGFTQGPARESGAEKLFNKMERYYTPGARRVMLLTWKADWRDIAEMMWRQSGGDGRGTVRIYAYSWGVGWGFVNLCYWLMRCGMKVEVAVLCDGVARSWFLPTSVPIAPLSMTYWIPKLIGWPNIKVYPNVEHITGFYQRQNRPCGHPLKIIDKEATTLHRFEELHVDHQHIDDSAAWRELSLEVAAYGPNVLKNL